MRRLARPAASVAAAFLLGLCMLDLFSRGRLDGAGEEAGTVVRAERFELVDDAGAVRAWLGVAADGSPCLALAGPQGKARAELRVGGDGTASFRCLREDGKGIAIGLEALARGPSRVVLCDQGGRARADLSAGAEAGAALPALDERVPRRRRGDQASEEWTGLRCMDREGRLRGSLSAWDSGPWGVAVAGKDEQAGCRFSAERSESLEPIVAVAVAAGRDKASVCLTPRILTLRDAEHALCLSLVPSGIGIDQRGEVRVGLGAGGVTMLSLECPGQRLWLRTQQWISSLEMPQSQPNGPDIRLEVGGQGELKVGKGPDVFLYFAEQEMALRLREAATPGATLHAGFGNVEFCFGGRQKPAMCLGLERSVGMGGKE